MISFPFETHGTVDHTEGDRPHKMNAIDGEVLYGLTAAQLPKHEGGS